MLGYKADKIPMEYLTHLLYLDLLEELPLYALDLNGLLRTERAAFALALTLLSARLFRWETH